MNFLRVFFARASAVLTVITICAGVQLGCSYEPPAPDSSWPSPVADDETDRLSPDLIDDDANDDDDNVDDDTGDDDSDDDTSDDDDDLSDPDRDGVSTADELAAGTDPNDPASAPAWHPEWSVSPRLILDRAGWEAVRDRWNDPTDLTGELAARIRAGAAAPAWDYPPEPYEPAILEYNAHLARSKALVAWLDDDPVLAIDAARICAESFSDMRAVDLVDYDKGTIHGGQALAMLAQTWDIMEGFGLASPTAREHCREAIEQIADDLWDYYVESWPVIPRLTQNNHNIKLASGFGMAGFVLNDKPVAAKYVNHALTQAPYFLFDRQNCDGGCQAEGPNYLDYTLLTFWPFAIAYHRFADGEPFPYHVDCTTRLAHQCDDEIVDVVDPLTDVRLAQILAWRLQVTMPNGWAAPFDDSNHTCGFPGLTAAILDDPFSAYVFENTPECRHAVGDLDVEMLALEELLPIPSTPEPASLAMIEAGQAVLRSGWGETDAFALVMGEHGRARVHGFGHEQADATGFIFHALGETFAMDSGYIGFGQRELVAGSKNHNVILVDGEGAPSGWRGVGVDVDAFLDDFVDTPELSQVRVRARYRGTDFERRVGLVVDGFFYVLDRITSSRTRNFTWLFHANAGPETDGVLESTAHGARIVRPNALMDLVVSSSPVALVISVGENIHGFAHDQILHHDVLHADVTGTSPIIGAVAPFWTDGDEPIVSLLSNDPNQLGFVVVRDGLRHALGFARTGASIDLPAVFTGAGRVTSDADVVYVRWSDEPAPDAVWRDGGSYVTVE